MNTRIMMARASAAAAMALIAASQAGAQLPAHLREYPLATMHKSGDIVAPFFDGWYDNGDGTVTYAFGFLNRNTEEIVDVALGPNNFIEPRQYDGVQPTHFPVYDRRGLTGKRERQAFAVTVPRGTEVWWTVTHAGRTYSVPGRATSPAYEMSREPAAFGSLHPAVRFDAEGPEATGPQGIVAARVTATVGRPVPLSVLVRDRGERYGKAEKETYPVGVTWIRHQGPAAIQFSSESSRVDGEGWAQATTTATFAEPGEYMVRVRVDNFAAPDSRFDNQCCWTNAFVPVSVRR